MARAAEDPLVTRSWSKIAGAAQSLVAGVLVAWLPGQHEPPAAPPAHETKPADQKRGGGQAPTHAPQPDLPPQVAFAHVRAGHAAWLAARGAGSPVPAPAERPAGAGRYVCAAIVCSDADLDLPTMLGLRRADVLLLSVPGPFVTPEVTAAIERQLLQERLSLVLVLTHTRCTTLQPPTGAQPKDVLFARADQATKAAERRGLPLTKSLALAQRELLLASAEELAKRVTESRLRVVAAEIDTPTGAITWHQKAIDTLPLAPVK